MPKSVKNRSRKPAMARVAASSVSPVIAPNSDHEKKGGAGSKQSRVIIRQAHLPSCWQNWQQHGWPAIPAPLAVSRMRRPKVDPSQADRKTPDAELKHLRNLSVKDLQARWHTVFWQRPLSHMSRYLLFRVLACRLQADRLGDLDAESRRLLDGSRSSEDAGRRAIELGKLPADLRPGTMLTREWRGRMHRFTVLPKGFAWNGKTYPSLTKVAHVITGTRWIEPRPAGKRGCEAGNRAVATRNVVVNVEA
jgi:Protein of unknown function (DUF2924)